MAHSQNVLLADVSELLLAQVFSCLLGQRRVTCLHAAVIKLGDRLIAFVGEAGAGKSTTALGLVQRGAEFVSDDVAALREGNDGFVVPAGALRIRLRPDAAAALAGAAPTLEPIWANKVESMEQALPRDRGGSQPTVGPAEAGEDRVSARPA